MGVVTILHPPVSSLLSTVETGVGTTAAFLITRWGLWNTQRQRKTGLDKSLRLSWNLIY